MSDQDRRHQHDFKHAISNGPNARPRDESIGQTAEGLPDDSGHPIDISPEEERRIAASILNGPHTDPDSNPSGEIDRDRGPDAAPSGRRPDSGGTR